MTHPASIAARFTGSLALLVLFLAASDARVASQTPAAKVDREYTLESSMLGYRGVGGDIEGVRNPALWARTGETVRIILVNGELMVHDLVVEALGVKHSADSRQGRQGSHHLYSESQRHLLLLCSWPPCCRNGGPHRSIGRGAHHIRWHGARGQRPPLNLDFEKRHARRLDGNRRRLRADQRRSGSRPDAGQARRQRSAYWAGSNTGGGAIRKGTLTSTPFKVTQPYASFLLSGGAFTSTRVDLLLVPAPGEKAERQVIFTMSGANSAHDAPGGRRPEAIPRQGHRRSNSWTTKPARPSRRTSKRAPWAHINFDQFRFHESRPFFPTEITSSEINTLPPMDPIKHDGLSGVEAAKAMTVPKGFTVKLAAAEPAIVRPIAFTLDDRGSSVGR